MTTRVIHSKWQEESEWETCSVLLLSPCQPLRWLQWPQLSEIGTLITFDDHHHDKYSQPPSLHVITITMIILMVVELSEAEYLTWLWSLLMIIISIWPGPPACRHLTKVLLCCSWYAASASTKQWWWLWMMMMIIIKIIMNKNEKVTRWQSSRCRSRAALWRPSQFPPERTCKGPLIIVLMLRMFVAKSCKKVEKYGLLPKKSAPRKLLYTCWLNIKM